MTPPNIVFACAQIALLVGLCAGLPRVLGLRSPAIHYVFWRVLLAACLLLPLVQPRRPAEMVFVPAPAGAALFPPGTDATPALAAPPAPAAIPWWTLAALVITAGTALRLGWIAIGMRRLLRMRTRAREEVSGFEDLARTVGVTAPILWSTDVSHPVTFGLLRPVVLLPVALKSVDVAAQRAVVAHELHHVKRRDWLWVVIEEIVRSVLWFHPAVWWLISRVQLARETVVDELSILTTNSRRAYLDTLLAFADDTGLHSSPAFSARRHLFHRVMLLSREEGMSSIRIAVGSCVLAVALGTASWGAVQAFPLHTSAQVPPPTAPPRDPLSPAAYHRMAVEYFQQMQGASLTDDRKLELLLKALAAEDRALELRPNYPDGMLFKTLLLRRQSELTSDPAERARIMGESAELQRKAMALRAPGASANSGGVPGGVAGGVPGGVAGGVPGGQGATHQMVFVPAPPMNEEFERHANELMAVRVGDNLKQPMKVRDVKPVFPPIAQQAKVQGVVILEVLIDTDGTVTDTRVLRSIPLLDQAALDAVQQWKFAPSHLNGMPQAVMMTVTVNFTLQ